MVLADGNATDDGTETRGLALRFGAVLFWPRHLAKPPATETLPCHSPRIASARFWAARDGWAVFLKARRMIAAGVPVLELTIGEHDIGTDAAILDEMHRAARAGTRAMPPCPASRRCGRGSPSG
jgi:hypothetical protein